MEACLELWACPVLARGSKLAQSSLEARSRIALSCGFARLPHEARSSLEACLELWSCSVPRSLFSFWLPCLLSYILLPLVSTAFLPWLWIFPLVAILIAWLVEGDRGGGAVRGRFWSLCRARLGVRFVSVLGSFWRLALGVFLSLLAHFLRLLL